MANKKVWFITGAGRGMGVEFVKAALAAGDAVVATGRDPDAVTDAVGKADDLLVNNAGNFYAGFFEELTPEQIERQLSTNLVGPMNVTRAVLPAMRKQRSGHIISISSGAGLLGFEFCTAYAAAKHGIEGWMESLAAEVARFGIHTTIVNPGFFRSALLTNESTTYADPSIDDYADARAQLMEWWKAQNGQQAGDPAKLGRALVAIANEAQPPRRFLAGADAIGLAEQKIAKLREDIESHHDLSTSLGITADDNGRSVRVG